MTFIRGLTTPGALCVITVSTVIAFGQVPEAGVDPIAEHERAYVVWDVLSREFAQASSYRQVDKDEITGAIPANAGGCKGGSCEQFIAIECSR